MRVKWAFLSVLVAITATVATWAALSGESMPLLLNLQELNLRVTEAEVRENISYYGTTLTPKKGYKLVVVNLQGSANKPCRIRMNVREFAAVYQKDNETEIITSSAVGFMKNIWSIAPEGGVGMATLSQQKAGQVEIMTAFLLPVDVTTFSVRYPTLAAGKAVLK